MEYRSRRPGAQPWLLLPALALVLIVALLAGPGGAGSGRIGAAADGTRSQGTSTNFITGVLPPPPPGSTVNYNLAGEPQIRAAADGSLYISSENGLSAGTDAWKSTDGGLQYSALAQPNAISSANTSANSGFAPGGGDTDLAIAPVKNGPTSNGQYNVYVASLTLGDVTVSASQDGGLTWSSSELGATVPADDREWIAAYDANIYYLSYHNIATGFQIIVNEGALVSGVPTTVQTYSAINPAQTDIYLGTAADNELGNIAVDPTSGAVAQIFVGCPPSPTAVASCSSFNTVYMAVGTPTGVNAAGQPMLAFWDYIVYQDSNPNANFANQFPNVAIDRAGNMYAAWSDDQNVYVSFSRDHGKSWSAPQRVNQGSAVTAIFPWMAAGDAGKVDIVYYGTPAPQNYQTCTAGTPGQYDCQNEPWYVFFAQDLNAVGGGRWQQQQVTGVVHYGGVCQGGVGCSSNGNDNRDLYDDFGVAVSPTTGLASIAYTSDQWDELQGTADAGACSASQSNTVSCVHTDFATQVGGTPILGVADSARASSRRGPYRDR